MVYSQLYYIFNRYRLLKLRYFTSSWKKWMLFLRMRKNISQLFFSQSLENKWQVLIKIFTKFSHKWRFRSRLDSIMTLKSSRSVWKVSLLILVLCRIQWRRWLHTSNRHLQFTNYLKLSRGQVSETSALINSGLELISNDQSCFSDVH